jgi:L-Ala-D/L-Glu epimerase / N-acetyl-D-glutamate racemase
MALKIVNVHTRVIAVPLQEPFAIATGAMRRSEQIITMVETNEGLTGLGAVAAVPSFMGETTETVGAAIRFLAPVVQGFSPFDIEALCEIMDSALPGNPTAKAAIDFACYDVMGKSLGVPVSQLIGGQYRQRIDCTWVIGIKTISECVREAVSKMAEGYRVLKIKIGHNDSEDAEKIRLLREELGSDAVIRVDANTAYTAERAIRVLDPLQRYNLEMIEQPCRKDDLTGMARVRNALKTPILADESAMGLAETYEVINRGAADIINIKLAKAGGIHKARKIAAVAEAANIPLLIGSNLELGPGVAAGVHFGAATAGVSYATDVFTGVQLHTHDIVEDIWDRQGMTIAVPQSVGLGIELRKKVTEN